MAAEIGQQAPEFTVPDQDGSAVSITDFRGETAVALVFFPFTFSGICETRRNFPVQRDRLLSQASGPKPSSSRLKMMPWAI